MGILPVDKIFCGILLLCAAACILQPVMADAGTITIAYRGAGGGYVGDTVVFDGRNTYGNTTLIRISGPGLPAEGVAPTDLNGPAGSATPASVDQYGAWKFVWYASLAPGTEKLQTAKYTFTASDSRNPGRTATVSFMLKQREYSLTASPDPVTPGGYVELSGFTEQEMTSVEIRITDAAGTILNSVTSPVSSSGYFSYGFHADLNPGEYRVTVSNPALKVPFGTNLTVAAGKGSNTTVTTPLPAVSTPAPATETSMVPAPSPTRSPAAFGTIITALAAGTGIFVRMRRS